MRDSKAFYMALPMVTAFTLIIAFLTGFHWREELTDVMCTAAKDQHCVRDWLNTFGTLSAGLVAGPVLFLGLRQLRNASRQHNDLLQLQMQPKLALTQRVGELVNRIKTANQLLRTSLNHDYDNTFTSAKDHEAAYELGYKNYLKIRECIASDDFDSFEIEVGSGEPRKLQDVRKRMDNIYQPSGIAVVGTAQRMFMTKRNEIMNDAEAAKNYAEACRIQAEGFIKRWHRND